MASTSKRQRLPLHGDVALRVGGGATNDANVDGESLVEQRLGAADGNQLDEVGGGARVDLPAAQARIDEGAEADGGEVAGPVRGDIAEQMGDHALRQVVGLDFVGDGQFLQPRH